MLKGMAIAVMSMMVGGIAEAESITGISFGGAGPTNWNTMTSSITSISNLIDETGAATGLSATISALSLNNYTPGVNSSSVPTHNPSLTALDHNLYSYTSGDSLTATISGLAADTYYGVYAFGLESGVPNESQIVTITGSGPATIFAQNLQSNDLAINSQNGSSANTLESYEIFVTSSNTGTISFNFKENGSDVTRYTAAGIAIDLTPPAAVPEPSSILLTASAGLMALGYSARRLRKAKAGA